MAGARKHLRSSTAHKRPTTAIEDGQIALNTNATSPGLFIKDSTGASILKIGPAHVGATAPNSSPAAGGSTGNGIGESWLDTSLTPVGDKVWDGTAWVNTTPASGTTVQGLVELATNAETQTGSDAARAVTPASLQSKVSDSTSTTSSTTIASSTAVKSAYDLANAALPKAGGTVTGAVVIGNTGSLSFEGSTDDAFETLLAFADPTADRTITFPDRTGIVLTTGDTGTITSTMIADGTIVNADINASAAIAGSKISPDFGGQNVVTTGSITGGSLIPSSATVPANGVYLPAANSVAISTNSLQRLAIDSSGRLLVGTSTAYGNGLLQIQGEAGDSTGAGFITLRRGLSDASIGNGTALGAVNFAGNSTGIGASISASTDAGTWGSGYRPSRLVFSVTADGASSPSEAVRINNASELLVGYTSDNGAYKLQVNSQIFATSATIATSDGRYKENVATLDGCVSLVKALRPVSFDWKHQEPITRINEEGETVVVREAHNFPKGTQVGFIAQEVETVLADKPWLGSVIKQNVRPAVTDNDGNELAPEEEFLGIAEGNLVAVLTSALKDAIGRIESLEARVAALEAV